MSGDSDAMAADCAVRGDYESILQRGKLKSFTTTVENIESSFCGYRDTLEYPIRVRMTDTQKKQV